MRNYILGEFARRDLRLIVKFDNKHEIHFYRSSQVGDDSYCAVHVDEDAEFIAEAELNKATFEKINEYHTDVVEEMKNITMYDSKENVGHFPPIILEEQVKIIDWAKGLLEQDVPFFSIIEELVSEKERNTYESSMEVRSIYKKYNDHWKDHILKSVLLGAYRLENGIKTGQLVTDGKYIGYAHNLDYYKRTFELVSVNQRNHRGLVGEFKIDDFWKYVD